MNQLESQNKSRFRLYAPGGWGITFPRVFELVLLSALTFFVGASFVCGTALLLEPGWEALFLRERIAATFSLIFGHWGMAVSIAFIIRIFIGLGVAVRDLIRKNELNEQVPVLTDRAFVIFALGGCAGYQPTRTPAQRPAPRTEVAKHLFAGLVGVVVLIAFLVRLVPLLFPDLLVLYSRLFSIIVMWIESTRALPT